MTDNDKKMIEAAKFLQEHCKESCLGKPCLFSSIVKNRCAGTDYCMLEDAPRNWNIPEPSRWTDADVALAKALMAFGVEKIHKQYDTHAITFNCDKINYEYHCLPEASFLDMKPDEYVYLKDIVAEGENYG